MNRRPFAVAFAAAALVYACAPHRAMTDSEPRKHAATPPLMPDTGALALTVTESGRAHTMGFALELKNAGKLTEVRFPNGRTHEFVVLDEHDREVWRWSTGRMFTQSLQTKQLKNGDALRFEATWDTAAPGKYRVVASLNSATHGEPVEREFVVR